MNKVIGCCIVWLLSLSILVGDDFNYYHKSTAMLAAVYHEMFLDATSEEAKYQYLKALSQTMFFYWYNLHLGKITESERVSKIYRSFFDHVAGNEANESLILLLNDPLRLTQNKEKGVRNLRDNGHTRSDYIVTLLPEYLKFMKLDQGKMNDKHQQNLK